jgi:hypothetical protein
MSVGVFTPSPIGTGVWHLIVEVLVVTRHSAPPGGSSRAEVMGCFAVSGDVVEPGAIRTAAAFFILILHQGVVLRVLAIPGDGTSRSTSQAQGPVFAVRVLSPTVGSVLPCQFSSLAILIHQLQKTFSGVGSYETLSYRFGASYVS